MNWTQRIVRLTAKIFPFEGTCLSLRQATLRARIARQDRIERQIAGKTDQEQEDIIKQWEDKYK